MPAFHRRFSIINQVIGLMLLIAVLGIIGMTISNRMIISVQGNAHAINKSGSLRMQSYRLLSLIPLNNHSEEYLNALENDLSSPELTQVIKSEDLTTQFSELYDFWLHTLRPALNKALTPNDARYEVIAFVNMLDELVHNIDEKTERKIAYVAMTQMIFIGLVFLLLMATIWHLRRKIYYPWMKLLTMANAIGQKDFSQRYPNNNKQDELNALGLTLNQMSDELAQSYHQLEQRVTEKTADLRNKNQVLSYLYQSNQILHSAEPLDIRLGRVLSELKDITILKNLSLRLYEDSNETYFHEICSSSNSAHSEDTLSNPKDNLYHPKTLSWELSDNIHRYGVIVAEIEANETLSDEQNNLVLMLVKQISGMLAMEHQIEQQQQLLIMDERSAIARELHDSIAQSLSCLKMQISYLQMQPESLPEKHQQLLSEMRNEINTAYSQLRELLTTFRLKLTEPGLLPSLENTINEFSQKMGFPVLLNYHLPAKSISPHQSIHIIQIIREALSNILKHAHANWAQVTLQQDSGIVTISIEDNGEGIGPIPDKQNHYGLIIMRERALSLNGKCDIIPRAQGGTIVKVTFSLPVA
ncbi:nitrate/nitrite two-component system sensor histidine kinase NarX [Providencia vermicola]|uniref:Sensor protein n=1 Tax=Providencia vermicola TaxID=333965 RepID=A0AAX3S0U2_9GAMM|nr:MULTISPECIES: nitrate/nitrite two-component system sensor histidine kinase NarX [Providencia]ELX8379104.1 nitrate/nitrite two-component system sensor histidine kinase NarX [Providencia stuartii]EMD5258308.1 nitrate/nitrite two-component system sensor histidine kinase NarX [Providencia stuartii]USB38407.1 nitrate/nitrite two-component system sensor histidine kinase NarX [Providencia vermicola]WFC07343.1 nitrate/nitrite two-component system sensor histidine kinase NarX [Providencia vermicola]